MGALTARELQRDGVLRVLAELYADPLSAELLLRGLGADLTRLPPFGGSQAPINHWFRICLTIEHGAFGFTLEDLVRAAHQDFPTNDVLGRFAGPRASDGAPDDRLTVLCLLAGPREASRLQLRHEFRTIEEAARRGRRRDLDIRLSAATRRRDLVPALIEHRPDVVHFGGHGSVGGELLLEEDDGSVAPVSAKALGAVLGAVGGVSVAVLNACHLGRYLDVVLPHVGEVIGSPTKLDDKDALAFCEGYYAALALGVNWEVAFDAGRAGVGVGSHDPSPLRRVVRVREGDSA